MDRETRKLIETDLWELQTDAERLDFIERIRQASKTGRIPAYKIDLESDYLGDVDLLWVMDELAEMVRDRARLLNRPIPASLETDSDRRQILKSRALLCSSLIYKYRLANSGNDPATKLTQLKDWLGDAIGLTAWPAYEALKEMGLWKNTRQGKTQKLTETCDAAVKFWLEYCAERELDPRR